jgi:3-isopropylmalate dehydrogenase
MPHSAYRIAVMPGDGIGVEVMDACRIVLNAATTKCGGPGLSYIDTPGGATFYQLHGTDLPHESLQTAREADAILFGAMGLPDVRKDDGTEINPQLDLRFALDLYAGVRPIRAFPGAPTPLKNPRAADIDLVLVRENTEGLFADIRTPRKESTEFAEDRCLITRNGAERVIDFSFRLARTRERHRADARRVTCVDKANVLHSMAYFRHVFDDVRTAHPDIAADYAYVDAMALNLVKRPWDYDVMVMENLLGDILSDLTAGIVGGLGMAPSGDVGDRHGLFQPSHGSAPDIAGQGIANPTAMFLSAAMMLAWLGERHSDQTALDAGRMIEKGVAKAFATCDISPIEFGGKDGTDAITQAVLHAL